MITSIGTTVDIINGHDGVIISGSNIRDHRINKDIPLILSSAFSIPLRNLLVNTDDSEPFQYLHVVQCHRSEIQNEILDDLLFHYFVKMEIQR